MVGEGGEGGDFVVEVGFEGGLEGVHEGEEGGGAEGLWGGEVDEVVSEFD